MDITTLKDRLISFDVRDNIKRIIYDLEEEIIKLNTSQIEGKGQNIFGSVIGIYSKGTEAVTGGRKRAGEPYDLFETGKFIRSFEINYRDDVIYFYATDNKTSLVLDTIDKHGLISDPESIFGLTIDNEKIVNFEMLLPELQERFNRHML